jgi:hypothetical protein
MNADPAFVVQCEQQTFLLRSANACEAISEDLRNGLPVNTQITKQRLFFNQMPMKRSAFETAGSK